MPSLNRIELIGRLGKDAELSYTQSGVAVARASIAVDNGKNAQGEKQPPEWFNLVFWRGTAEYASEYLHKGSLVFVEGELHQRKYKAHF